MPMEKSALFCLLLGVVFAETRPLNRFISHYEPLEYDHHGLMWNHHRVRRSLIGQRSLNLKFHALGRDFDLELVPDKHLFHPNFTLQDREMPLNKGDVLSYLYTGTDKNDPTSHVHGNVVHGVFEGSIFTEEEMYWIEPSSRYFEDADVPPSFHSVIYRLSDLDTSAVSGTPCGATQEVLKRLRKTQNSVPRKDRTEARSGFLKRQVRDPTRVRCWLNVIGDYKFFEAMTTPSLTTFERVSQATSLLGSIIRVASTIYETTDFTFDGGVDFIEFGIRNLVIESQPPPVGDFFANEFIGVEAFLTEHSANNWNDSCLSYRFTYRDFDGGVLGLAYVGQTQAGGAGICAPFREPQGETLNTGIVTLLNYGQRVPSMVTTLTFAHEAGHNFGSNHDPETNECAPGGGDGNFIMYAFASSGNAANNDEFSPCSRRMMDDVIEARGQNADGCFVESGNNCGNGIVDDGEQCDCGGSNNFDTDGICNNDPCCNGMMCNRTVGPGIECSPDEGPCCNSSCAFVADVMCAMPSECAFAQFCDGTSAACPALVPRDDALNGNLTCTDGSGLCADDGTCTATVCEVLDLSSCECTEPELSCDVCCQLANGTCASTIRIAEENTDGLGDMLPDGMGRAQLVGFPCGNFTGYCDFFNNCMPVDSEGALDRLLNFFSPESINAAIDWLRRMWWVVVIAGVGIIVGLFFVVLIVHKLLPRPEHVKRRAERRKSLRRSYKRGNRAGALVTTGHELQNPNFVGQ